MSDSNDDDRTYRSKPGIPFDPQMTSRPRGGVVSTSKREGRAPSVGEHKSGLRLGRALGRGGQAAILEGVQESLRRDVAVKQLLSEDDDSDALLREAYVTGALEHPNIVPVHDLVFDARGLPQLVLKRIEGRSWLDFVRSPELLTDIHGGDPLEWHIRVTLQLTRALSFAHERGIMHRDIKPSNVMIGSFGEVYLLDWGLAASFDPSEEFLPRVPTAEIAGTSAYMAPEQLVGLGRDLGPRTDVYLLAASLWHAVCGTPPWRRVEEERVRVPASAPIPKELGAILDRALLPDHHERTSSAETFRRELEDFLHQRGSHLLVERAIRRARVADKAWAAGDIEAAEYSATEAAVLFRAAREEWPENPAAHKGEETLLRARVAHALDRGQPAVAGQLLAATTHAPADLLAEVEEAAKKADAEASRLSALGREADKGVEVDFRRYALLSGGAFWIGLWIAGVLIGDVGFVMLGLSATVFLSGVGAFVTRDRWTKTRHNRATIGSWLIGGGGACALAALAIVQGAAFEEFAAWVLVLFAVATLLGAVTVDARAGLYGCVWAAMAIVSFIRPAWAGWLVAFGNIAMIAIGLWVNLQNRRASRSSAESPAAPPSVTG